MYRIKLLIGLLFLILLIQNKIYSQNTSFEFSYSTNDDEYGLTIYEDTLSNEYIISGGTRRVGSNHIKGLFLTIDNYGNLVQQEEIIDNSQSFSFTGISKVDEDSIVFCGMKYDTSDSYLGHTNSSLVYYFTDLNLQYKDSLYFQLPAEYSYFLNYYRELENNSKFFLGSLLDTTYELRPIAYMYEFSQKFDSVKFIFWPDSLGSAQDIKLLSDNRYFVLMEGLGDWVARYYTYDSNFNILSKKWAPNFISDPFGVKWDSDTSFYIAGEWNGGTDDIGINYQNYLEPYNPTKNIYSSWGTTDTLDLTAYNGALDFNNKDSVYIGGMSNWFREFNSWPTYLFIIQTDSLLNVRWERFYGGDAYYFMSQIIATSDGGCIAVGSKYDYRNTNEEERDLYVLKLNAEGLLVSSPETPSIEMHEAIVYPNPGTNEIKVRIAAQYPESLFQLFDMNGKQIASEKMFGKFGSINTGFLKPGAYIYRISSMDGLFETGKWVKK